jgi:hypothetical protein
VLRLNSHDTSLPVEGAATAQSSRVADAGRALPMPPKQALDSRRELLRWGRCV